MKEKKVSQEKKEDKLQESKDKLEECQKLKDEYLTNWQRARADLINYKKEERERVDRFLELAGEGLVLEILPVLDNFEAAEKNLSVEQKENSHIKGLLQIKKQLLDFLKSQGLEEIEAMGKKFDPNLHEVAEEVEGKEKESGVVLEEIQKGYSLNGKLLRPSKVKVTK